MYELINLPDDDPAKVRDALCRLWVAYHKDVPRLDRYFAEFHSLKSIPNKLHPCLVESRVTPEKLPESEDFDRTLYDQLDYVSMYAYKLTAEADDRKLTAEGLREMDYKIWDYPAKDAALRVFLKAD